MRFNGLTYAWSFNLVNDYLYYLGLEMSATTVQT